MGDESTRMRWGRFRFSVIGSLLAAPPEHGELQAALGELAGRSWRHPTTGEAVRFGLKTIERWYYVARHHPADPVGALARKTPGHAGTHPSVSDSLATLIRSQWYEHPRWTFQLHYDNLAVLVLAELVLAHPFVGFVKGLHFLGERLQYFPRPLLGSRRMVFAALFPVTLKPMGFDLGLQVLDGRSRQPRKLL